MADVADPPDVVDVVFLPGIKFGSAQGFFLGAWVAVVPPPPAGAAGTGREDEGPPADAALPPANV